MGLDKNVVQVPDTSESIATHDGEGEQRLAQPHSVTASHSQFLQQHRVGRVGVRRQLLSPGTFSVIICLAALRMYVCVYGTAQLGVLAGGE